VTRLLVVAPCTKEKATDHPRRLVLADFRRGPAHVRRRARALASLARPAEAFYAGPRHLALLRGVQAVRRAARARRLVVDLRVLSAGYGLLAAGRSVVPYDATFKGMRPRALAAWAARLGIPAAFRRAVRRPYRLGVVALPRDYLEALALGPDLRLGGPTLVVCGPRTARSLPRVPGLVPVVVSIRDTTRLGCTLVTLPGEVASRLLEAVARGVPARPGPVLAAAGLAGARPRRGAGAKISGGARRGAGP
jgi:hypothetical protein